MRTYTLEQLKGHARPAISNAMLVELAKQGDLQYALFGARESGAREDKAVACQALAMIMRDHPDAFDEFVAEAAA